MSALIEPLVNENLNWLMGKHPLVYYRSHETTIPNFPIIHGTGAASDGGNL